MKNSSIDDVKLIKLPVFKDLKGDLIPIETNTHIPIEVKEFSNYCSKDQLEESTAQSTFSLCYAQKEKY